MKDIFLIGGVPRCGKTTLAQKISADFGMPWVSTDALEAVAHAYVPEEKQGILFPKAAMRRKTHYSNDELYNVYSVEEIVNAYSKQAEATARAIEALAMYASNQGWRYVIEGYHVTPHLITTLQKRGVACTAVVLVNTQPESAIERSKHSAVKSDWVRDKTSDPVTFVKIAETLRVYSARLAQEASECGVRVFNMSEPLQEGFSEAYTYLTAETTEL